MEEREKEGRDNTHNPDNITLVKGTENTKVKKSVTFQDDKVAYISKGVKEKTSKVSNKDKNDEEKGNNIRKTSGEQVPDASAEAEGKDRKDPDKDETKKEKANITQETNDEKV